jgi:hypothetical protein
MLEYTEDEQYNEFTFINEIEDRRLHLSFRQDNLHEVIANFEEFLRGCGFVFDGHLDIVPNEDPQLHLFPV